MRSGILNLPLVDDPEAYGQFLMPDGSRWQRGKRTRFDTFMQQAKELPVIAQKAIPKGGG